MKRRLVTHLLISLFLIGAWQPVAAKAPYEFTLLIYMNGSDLESEYKAATDDLLEMVRGSVGKDVAVIIETGGTKTWHGEAYGLPAISAQENQRFRMTDSNLEYLGTVGKKNMGDSDTLKDFLDFGMTHYPSDQYGLIMWNHGAGAVYGYGADELHDHDTLTLEELQKALKDNFTKHPKIFDLIGFDACLMASIETAHVLEPYAKYLVGSEELEPGHGWSYTEIMNYLTAYDDPEPEKLGRAIIGGFLNQSEKKNTAEAITISLIDLSKVPTIRAALDPLFAKMTEGLGDKTTAEGLLKARHDSESYGAGGDGSNIRDSDMVDIIDYATNLNEYYPHHAENVVLAVQAAVVQSVGSPYKPKAAGLSMYVPALDKETMAKAPAVMKGIGLSQAHTTFLATYNEVVGGPHDTISFEGQVTQGSEDDALKLNLEGSIKGDDQFYYFKINPEDLPAISTVATLMGKVEPNGNIHYLAQENVAAGAKLKDGTILGETLSSWVTIQGITVAMYYERQSEENARTYYIPITLNGAGADLIVLFSETNPQGKVLGARKLNTGNQNVYNRNLIALQPEDVLQFVYQRDRYDIVTDSYSAETWYEGATISVGEGLTLTWQDLPKGEYAYAFRLQDIYGNRYQTDWVLYSQAPTVKEPDTPEIPGAGGENTPYPWHREGAEKPSDWALPHITTAFNNGLTTERTLENYTHAITRELFCELVVKLYEKAKGEAIPINDPKPFTDTDNTAVAKAYGLGVVSGYGDGRFGPDALITREQLMAMFFRTLSTLDDRYETLSYPELNFEDTDNLSDWALTPAKSLVSFGLINGVGEGRLAPKDNATIEQSLKLVNGVYEFNAIQKTQGGEAKDPIPENP